MVTPIHLFASGRFKFNFPSARVRRYKQRTRNFAQRLFNWENLSVNTNEVSTSTRNIDQETTDAVNTSVTLLNSTSKSGIPVTRVKCVIWTIFILAAFIITGAKFYFSSGTNGMEAVAFCIFPILILIIGGFVLLYDTVTTYRCSNPNPQVSVQISDEPIQNEIVEKPTVLNPSDIEPPPYRIAIIIPTPTEEDESSTIRKEPSPPSYEKAIN